MMLYLKHRPTTWNEYVGQPKAVKQVRRIIERPGFDRGAFWIECAGANNSGVGKTCLAWLVAGQLADDFFITEMDGSKCDKAAVAAIERAAWLMVPNPDKPFRAWIINESHAISKGAVDAFLTFLEALPKHCVVIFTTTRAVDDNLFGDRDSGPFASRCHQVRLTNQGISEPFAQRAKAIAQAEGLDGKLLGAYVRLVRSCGNNLRMTLQRVEAGEMVTD